MKIVLSPNDTVTVELIDTDGEFTIAYGPDALTVHADLPDTSGRVGEIYSEQFGVATDVLEEFGEVDEFGEIAEARAHKSDTDMEMDLLDRIERRDHQPFYPTSIEIENYLQDNIGIRVKVMEIDHTEFRNPNMAVVYVRCEPGFSITRFRLGIEMLQVWDGEPELRGWTFGDGDDSLASSLASSVDQITGRFWIRRLDENGMLIAE